MLNFIKNIFIRYNLQEEIEYLYECIDSISCEISDYDRKNAIVPTEILSELKSYENMIRRIQKLKEKYR